MLYTFTVTCAEEWASTVGLAAKKPVDRLSETPSVHLSGPEQNQNEATVSITVVGASGDLAKKKIFPSLFALFYEDFLPKVFSLPSLYVFICIYLFLNSSGVLQQLLL